MVLYIIRHGDPDYENDTLTPAGQKEAEAVGARMAAQGLDRIYTSPRGRAVKTSLPTCRAAGLSGTVEDWMTERDEYMLRPDLNGPDAAQAGYTFSLREGVRAARDFCQDGQRAAYIKEVAASSDAFLARHGYRREGGLYRVERPNSLRIACFCHGGFGAVWIAHLLGMMPAMGQLALNLHTASVTRFTFAEAWQSGYAPARLDTLNDISHLISAGLAACP